MSLRFTCPHCLATYPVELMLAGKRILCRKCSRRSVVPRPSAKTSERKESQLEDEEEKHLDEDSPNLTGELPLLQQVTRLPWSGLVSVLWIGVGLLWALSAPGYALGSGGRVKFLNTLPLLLTGLFIGWNLLASVRLVIRTRSFWSAWTLTLIQILLFLLLFVQIGCHQGMHHYRWDKLPGWWDWAWFALIHAIRAGDLADFIEAYDLPLQTIHNGSGLTATCLILYHLMVNLFFVALFVSLVSQGLKKLKSALSANQLTILLVVLSVLFLLAWLSTALVIRPWRLKDIFLWPLDNALRVVDFVDAMEIFQVRLHGVTKGFWESTLTFVFRLMMGVAVAVAFNRLGQAISLRWLGGFGLSREELEILHRKHPDPRLRRKAEKQLKAHTRAIQTVKSERKPALWVLGGAWGVAGCLCLLLLVRAAAVAGNWKATAEEYARIATDPEHPDALKAAGALKQMGGYAEDAVPALAKALPKLPRERQLVLIDTLGSLGPAAVQPLSDMTEASDEELVLQAVRVLRNMPTVAIPILEKLIYSPNKRIREEVKAALTERDAYNPDHVLLKVIEDLMDPDLNKRQPAAEVLHHGHSVSVHHRLGASLDQKRELALPALLQVLNDYRKDFHYYVTDTLGQMGPRAAAAIPSLMKTIQDNKLDGVIRRDAIKALVKIAPASTSVPVLTRVVQEGWHNTASNAREAQYSAVIALGEIGPAASSAIPTLLAYQKSIPQNPDVGFALGYIKGALEKIDQKRQQRHGN